MRRTTCFLTLAFLVLSACTSAPKETVELAEIVDQQIAAMQASHERFVSLYYAKLRDEVETFMETRWIPLFLSNVVEGKGAGGRAFRADLDRAYKLATLDWESVVKIQADEEVQDLVREALSRVAVDQQAGLGRVLIEFSTAAQTQINLQRRKLLDPIDAQEAHVLGELRASYASLLSSSAAIKGYLASVVELTAQRDAILDKVGLLDEQKMIVAAAVKASDGAARALRTAKSADEAIAKFLDRLGVDLGDDDSAEPTDDGNGG